ncbi:MAG: hypothetical protein ACK4WH_02695 [Phycisphaerales bacterium]
MAVLLLNGGSSANQAVDNTPTTPMAVRSPVDRPENTPPHRNVRAV